MQTDFKFSGYFRRKKGTLKQGGKDQGLPILVSEIHSGGFISRNKNLLYVGDILKSVNGEDLQCISHSKAVELLSEKVFFFAIVINLFMV